MNLKAMLSSDEEDQIERKHRRRQKVVNFFKSVAAFSFSHIGLACLVVAYTIMGGFMFRALEAPTEKQEKLRLLNERQVLMDEVWRYVTLLDSSVCQSHPGLGSDLDDVVKVIDGQTFNESVRQVFIQFQHHIHTAVKDMGWDGNDNVDDGSLQWSLAGAILYAITVITTIGYGHVAPKTIPGRLLTIIYALVGIPLTFLYLSNIGNFLADCFRLFYKKICCDIICCQKCYKKKKKERLRSRRRREITARWTASGFDSWSVRSQLQTPLPYANSTSTTKVTSTTPDISVINVPEKNKSRATANIKETVMRAKRKLVSRSKDIKAPESGGWPGGTNLGFEFEKEENDDSNSSDTIEPCNVKRFYNSNGQGKDSGFADADNDGESSYSGSSLDKRYHSNQFNKTHSEHKAVAKANKPQVLNESLLQNHNNRKDKLRRTCSLSSIDGTESILQETVQHKKHNQVNKSVNSDMSKEIRLGILDELQNAIELQPAPYRHNRDFKTFRDRTASVASKKSEIYSIYEPDNYVTDSSVPIKYHGNTYLPKTDLHLKSDKMSKDKAKQNWKMLRENRELLIQQLRANNSANNNNKEELLVNSQQGCEYRNNAIQRYNETTINDSSERFKKGTKKKLFRSISTPPIHQQVESYSHPSSNTTPHLNVKKLKYLRSTERRISENSNDHGTKMNFVDYYPDSSSEYRPRVSEESFETANEDEDEVVVQPKLQSFNICQVNKNQISMPNKTCNNPDKTFYVESSLSEVDIPEEMDYHAAWDDNINRMTSKLERRVDWTTDPSIAYFDDTFEQYDNEEKEKVTVPVVICLVIIGGYLLAGSAMFAIWEGWDYITGSYFCFVTLSTIGFGDIVPGTDMTQWAAHAKLVLCALWLAFGLSLLAMCFNLMQEEVREKCKWIGQKLGLLKDEDHG